MNQQQAHRLVHTALKTGALVRPDTCSKCGKKPRSTKDGRAAIQGHHKDYSQPLDVEWICAACHRKETPLPKIMGAPTFGSRNGQAKLSETAAIEIRNSKESGPVLAARYGVNRSTINRIKGGVHWLAAAPKAGA